jgi:hypothetical protein
MIHFFPPRARPRSVAESRLDASRWAVVSKAAAAIAVADGHLTEREACEFCDMEPRELEVWQHVVQDHGLRRMFAGSL